MAYKKVETSGSSDRKFVNLKDASKGDVLLEGLYKGLKPSNGRYGGEDCVFQTSEGTDTYIGASGQLLYLVQELSAGDFVKLVYNGKEEIKKGKWKGSMAHAFEMYVDEERKGKVPEASASNETTDEDDLPF